MNMKLRYRLFLRRKSVYYAFDDTTKTFTSLKTKDKAEAARLLMAKLLLLKHNVLILDEPTNGLDPQGTREVRKLVRDLAGDGSTVLVSSHLLSEIEQVATHVGMMSGGRLVRQGTLAEVLADGAPRIRIATPDLDAAQATMRRLGLNPGPVGNDARDVIATLGDVVEEDVARALVEAGVRLRGLTVERPDLEDLFVSITGEGFDVLR